MQTYSQLIAARAFYTRVVAQLQYIERYSSEHVAMVKDLKSYKTRKNRLEAARTSLELIREELETHEY